MKAKATLLRVFLVKPSRYLEDGWVERYRRGVHFNTTLSHIWTLTPDTIDGVPIEVVVVDEWVQRSLDYLQRLRPEPNTVTLLALVGVYASSYQRALDLAAYARSNGVKHVVLGGPHAMTCDTSEIQQRGVSVSTSEAEVVWTNILQDALAGELQPVYGHPRWAPDLNDAKPLIIPDRATRRRYFLPAIGIYPSRGCPFNCSYCSVVKLAGHRIRSEPVEITLESLRRARAAGVRLIHFTSDNFNKIPRIERLLESMIRSGNTIPFAAQVDSQLGRAPELVSLMARAGCVLVSIGVESLSPASLKAINKSHNKPERYADLTRLLHRHGIAVAMATMVGHAEDTEESILGQVDVFRRINPDMTLFSILTPLPGSRVYDDMMAAGALTEPNLDRYDVEHLTFHHPTLSAEQFGQLRRRCMSQLHRPNEIARRVVNMVGRLDWRRPAKASLQLGLPLGASLYWFADVLKGPMPPNGVGRIRLDHLDSYLPLRRESYGFALAPLPQSLQLSQEDLARDRRTGQR